MNLLLTLFPQIKTIAPAVKTTFRTRTGLHAGFAVRSLLLLLLFKYIKRELRNQGHTDASPRRVSTHTAGRAVNSKEGSFREN
jgi:hypothetical protein